MDFIKTQFINKSNENTLNVCAVFRKISTINLNFIH